MSFNTRNANNVRDDFASNYITGGNGSGGISVDLLDFGYVREVFRDDIKALDIDQGKHLIPLMGDHNLKMNSIVDVVLKGNN
uniref:Uncharacterized protein n=1 Tax=Glossina palpalis gambiensis TaxID=67801 RepID=A0A1B0BIG1_9MUSC